MIIQKIIDKLYSLTGTAEREIYIHLPYIKSKEKVLS